MRGTYGEGKGKDYPGVSSLGDTSKSSGPRVSDLGNQRDVFEFRTLANTSD